jgi:Histidine kinase
MTSAVDSVLVARPQPVRTLAFVWSAWRSLTRRHFYYAALVGLGLGLLDGTGVAMWVQGIWWKKFLSVFVPNLANVLLLLLCLSVAANVRVIRGPRWTPFVVAATVASVIASFVQWAVGLFSGDSWSLFALCVNLTGGLFFSTLAALGYMYAFDALRRTDVLRNLQLERTRVARDAYEARLKALQARVEPRFLFDTLSDIEAAYEKNPDAGQRLIDELIVYLRAALPTIEQPTSLLSTELALVRAWLRIVQMREPSRLNFSIMEPDQSGGFRMPSMVLLPLVQHAVESMRACSRCTITVSADIGDRRARIVVTAGPGCELPTETAATAAIHERLRVIFGPQATLQLVNTEHNDYRAELEIPA